MKPEKNRNGFEFHRSTRLSPINRRERASSSRTVGRSKGRESVPSTCDSADIFSRKPRARVPRAHSDARVDFDARAPFRAHAVAAADARARVRHPAARLERPRARKSAMAAALVAPMLRPLRGVGGAGRAAPRKQTRVGVKCNAEHDRYGQSEDDVLQVSGDWRQFRCVSTRTFEATSRKHATRKSAPPDAKKRFTTRRISQVPEVCKP